MVKIITNSAKIYWIPEYYLRYFAMAIEQCSEWWYKETDDEILIISKKHEYPELHEQIIKTYYGTLVSNNDVVRISKCGDLSILIGTIHIKHVKKDTHLFHCGDMGRQQGTLRAEVTGVLMGQLRVHLFSNDKTSQYLHQENESHEKIPKYWDTFNYDYFLTECKTSGLAVANIVQRVNAKGNLVNRLLDTGCPHGLTQLKSGHVWFCNLSSAKKCDITAHTVIGNNNVEYIVRAGSMKSKQESPAKSVKNPCKVCGCEFRRQFRKVDFCESCYSFAQRYLRHDEAEVTDCIEN